MTENIETFLTVLAWFGLFIGGLMTLVLVFNAYELNNTTHGKLRQALARCQGRVIVPRSPTPYILMFIVSLAWLVSQGY